MEILRIIKGTGSTSAGLNNFIYTRSSLNFDERQTYLELFNYNFPKDSPKFNFMSAKNSYIRLTKIVFQWIRKTTKDSVIHVHSPALIIFTVIAKYLSFQNIPVIFSIHNHNRNFSLIQKIFIFAGFIFSSRVVFVSNDSHESFNKGLYKRIIQNKSKVITNGADFEQIKTFKKSKYKKHCKKIISVSRLVEQKNIFLMIDVFSRVNFNFMLNIYGAGHLQKELENYIRSKKLGDSIKLYKPIERKNYYKKLQEHDLYISTSDWEGMPQALIEAAGIGLPCIVSNIPSHCEIAQEAKHVKCCKSKNSIFWANILNEFCEKYSDNVPISNKDLENFYSSKFSAKKMHFEYHRVYKSGLKDR